MLKFRDLFAWGDIFTFASPLGWLPSTFIILSSTGKFSISLWVSRFKNIFRLQKYLIEQYDEVEFCFFYSILFYLADQDAP